MTKTLYAGTFENNLPFKSDEYTTDQEGKRINAFQYNLDQIYERIEKRLPSLIIIDGGSGQGKSTFGTEIVDYYNNKKGLPPINLTGVQYAKGGKDFTKKLRQAHADKYPAIIYDEGGDLNRKTTLSKFNRTMDMVFNQLRIYDLVIILITQSVGYLENDLFTKGIVRMLINCYGRTNLTKSYFRAYELDRINYLRQAIKKEVTPIKAYQKITANNYGVFYNISQEREDTLHEVGYAKKDEDISLSDIKMDGLINYQEIAHRTKQSITTVKIKIGRLHIKPEKLYKKKAYFKEEIIYQL
jgi:ABC-type oligopeptide transport system ATPase subunit